MKKGFLGGFLTCALVMALISTAFAAHSRTDTLYFRDIKLMVNGELVEVTDSTGAKIEPFIINGTTYLPVGNVAKMVGYDVKWDGETSTVILELPEAKRRPTSRRPDPNITRTAPATAALTLRFLLIPP